MAVELRDDQLDRALKHLDFPSCLAQDWKAVAAEEQPEIEHRAIDVLIQTLCGYKLNLAIDEGLEPESQRIAADQFDEALERVITLNRTRLVASVRQELGLPISDESPA